MWKCIVECEYSRVSDLCMCILLLSNKHTMGLIYKSNIETKCINICDLIIFTEILDV